MFWRIYVSLTSVTAWPQLNISPFPLPVCGTALLPVFVEHPDGRETAQGSRRVLGRRSHQAPGLRAMESPVLASRLATALPLRTRFSGTCPHQVGADIAVSIRHFAQPIEFLPWATCVALQVAAVSKPRPKTFRGMVTGPRGRFSRWQAAALVFRRRWGFWCKHELVCPGRRRIPCR